MKRQTYAAVVVFTGRHYTEDELLEAGGDALLMQLSELGDSIRYASTPEPIADATDYAADAEFTTRRHVYELRVEGPR